MTDFIERIERLEEEKAGIAGDMGEVLADHKLWLDTDGREGKRADLRGAILQKSNLELENLVLANLSCADLRGAYLYGANLQNSNLEKANLSKADMRWANLSGAYLSKANLSGAELWGTIGNRSEIKSLQLDTYSITYTFDRLQIDCMNRSIAEWRGFSDEDIEKKKHLISLTWWKKYRDVIFQIIELSPATPTGHEGNQQ